jgi:hypothetical protein
MPGLSKEDRRRRYFGQGSRKGQAKTAERRRNPEVTKVLRAIRDTMLEPDIQAALRYRLFMELYGYEPIVISKVYVSIAAALDRRTKPSSLPEEKPQRAEALKKKFEGWTPGELKEYAVNGYVPPRFRDKEA